MTILITDTEMSEEIWYDNDESISKISKEGNMFYTEKLQLKTRTIN